jgi:hypothetical protein
MELEKQMICSELNQLDKDNKIRILSIIKKYDESKIQKFSDGSRVDLDSLSDEVIELIYSKLNYILKLEK